MLIFSIQLQDENGQMKLFKTIQMKNILKLYCKSNGDEVIYYVKIVCKHVQNKYIYVYECEVTLLKVNLIFIMKSCKFPFER